MARSGTAARRYAEAVFDLATRDDALDRWATDLGNAAAMLSNEQAARIVESPAVPAEERRALVHRLLEGRVSEAAERLIALLIDRGRVDLLPAVATEYAHLLNRRRGIVEATVTSAAPLTPDELRAVQAKVEQMSESKVELRTAVDESLIGGLTVRIGDRLLDASVRGRLERLRDQLVAEGAAGR